MDYFLYGDVIASTKFNILIKEKTNSNAKNLYSNATSFVANLFAPVKELATVRA